MIRTENCLQTATMIPRMMTSIEKRSHTMVSGEISLSATLVARTRITCSSSCDLGLSRLFYNLHGRTGTIYEPHSEQDCDSPEQGCQ